MTVIVSKSALNLREELSALKKPSGIKGEELLRANTTDELYNVIGRNRNLIINGGFNVWQRGTTGTVVGGPAYCSADRWKCYVNTNTTITLSRQTFTPGQKEVPGNPTYYARFDWLGTGASQFFGFEQLIEGCHHGAGDFITVSFYARSERSDDMNLGVSQKCDGSADVSCGDRTFNLEPTWKRFVYTYPMPSLVGKTIGANNALAITFYRSGILNSYLDIANVQVEVGTTATPFEYRNPQQELDLCRRYCRTVLNGGETSGFGFCNGAAATFFMFDYGTPMRSTPSLSYSGTLNISNYASNLSTITGVAAISTAANSGGVRTAFTLNSTPSAVACGLNPNSNLVLITSEL